MISAYRQQGTALITALFIMAIIAAASAAILWRQSVSIQQTSSILHYHEMELAADGVTLWAISSLVYNINHPHPDELTDTIPMRYPALSINTMVISGQVDDELAKFNINNLTDVAWQAVFVRLIKNVYPSIKNPEEITQAISAWIKPYDMGSSQYDEKYRQENSKFLPSHQAMVEVSELRMVEGITPDLMSVLVPYITALPDKTKINVNTAPAIVIMSVVPGMTIEAAVKLETDRQKKPFLTLEEFINNPDVKYFQFNNTDVITVSSQYFSSHAMVKRGKEIFRINSLLKRDETPQGNQVKVIWQKLG